MRQLLLYLEIIVPSNVPAILILPAQLISPFIDVPAFKLLYQSLKKSIRFDVQARIDGTINEIAALTSGILLGALGLMAFIELIHFSVFLFVLLIIWAFITARLYKEYRNSLERALQQDLTATESDIDDPLIVQFRALLNAPEKFTLKLNQHPELTV